MAEDLRRFVADGPIQARQPSPLERLRRGCPCHPRMATLAALLLLVSAASLGIALHIAGLNARLEEASGSADRARHQAEEQAEKSRRDLVRQYVANGNRLVEEGDYEGALPWLAEALRLDAGRGEEEYVHRVRLAAVLRRCPRAVQVWQHSPCVTSRFSPAGDRVLIATRDSRQNGEVRVLDAYTGRDVLPPLRPGAAISQTEFSSDGQRIVTVCGSFDRLPLPTTFVHRVQLWDAATGRAVGPAVVLKQLTAEVAFTPAGDKLLFVWHEPGSPAAMPLLEGGDRAELRLVDCRTGQAVGPVIRADGLSGPLSISPDGRHVLVNFAGADKPRQPGAPLSQIQVWDLGSGKPVGPALDPGLMFGIRHLFSPRGDRVLSYAFPQAQLWEVATGRELAHNLEHAHPIESAQFSSDGRHLVTVAAGVTQWWDAATGQRLASLGRQDEGYAFGGFRSDLRQALLLRSWERVGGLQDSSALFSPAVREFEDRWQEVRFQDPFSGTLLAPTLRQPLNFRTAAFAPEGRRVLTVGVSAEETRVWDLAPCRPSTPPLAEGTSVVCLSADGSRIVTREAGRLRVRDLSGRLLSTLQETAATRVTMALFNATARRVLTRRATPTAATEVEKIEFRVWDAATGAAIGRPIPAHGIAARGFFSGDGKLLAIVSHGTPRPGGKTRLPEIALWKVDTGQPLRPSPLRTGTQPLASVLGPHQVAFTPDQRRLIALGVGTIEIWTLPDGRPVPMPRGEEWTSPPPMLPGLAGLTDFYAEEEITDALRGRAGQELAFSPDGRRMVICTRGYRARLVDLASLTPHDPPLVHRGRILHVAFSPDGRRVVTASTDGSARVWDAANARPLTAALKHGDEVKYAAFHPGNRLLVTTTRSGACRVWDAVTGEPVTPPLRLAPPVSGNLGMALRRPVTGEPAGAALAERAVFSADGDRLVVTVFLPPVSGSQGLAIAPPETWDLSPDRRSAAELVRLAEVHTGQRLEGGVLVPMPAAEIRAARRALQAKYPAEFSLTQTDVLRWVEEQAAECEDGLQWTAALSHLTRLVDARAADSRPRARRARTYAHLSEWDRAAADFTRVVESDKATPVDCSDHALLRWHLGDAAGHRAACATLLRRFGNSEDPAVLATVIWACVRSSDSGIDAASLLKLAGRLSDSTVPAHRMARAAVLVRNGRWAEATPLLEKAATTPEAAFFLVMAPHRSGKSDEAKKTLNQAAISSRSTWQQRLEGPLLHREALAVLEK